METFLTLRQPKILIYKIAHDILPFDRFNKSTGNLGIVKFQINYKLGELHNGYETR